MQYQCAFVGNCPTKTVLQKLMRCDRTIKPDLHTAGQALKNRLYLIFNCGFAGEDGIDELGVKLRYAVIGVKAVLFLFNVGQLGVAKTEHILIVHQHVC